eukprot:SAG22_NODE_12494_length_440_cov_1.586510_1_plen_50_part_10
MHPADVLIYLTVEGIVFGVVRWTAVHVQWYILSFSWFAKYITLSLPDPIA